MTANSSAHITTILEPDISRENRSGDVFHTFCLNPVRHWLRVRREHSPTDPDFADRVLAISLISPLMELPCAAEKLFYGRKIRNTQIDQPPVFVIGHWRSGTTLLHNALSKDPQFGFVSLFQTLMPGSFLVGRRTLQPLLALRAPNTRPMDNVKIRMQYPSEEEYALSHVCPESLYLGFNFPLDWTELFDKYAMMEGISSAEREEWIHAYREIIVKATIHFGGRRIVLKNPVNTARIRAVREAFPGAKFIHIYRNPYDVYRSTLHLYREVFKVTALQRISDEQIQRYVLDLYPRVMNAYWEQRAELPENDHVEVRYEDFIQSPMQEIERMYRVLGLGGFESARLPMERFLGSRTQFRPNEYTRDPAERDIVQRHWGQVVERLGYTDPDPAEVATA